MIEKRLGSMVDATIEIYEKYFFETLDKDTVCRLNSRQNKRRRFIRRERGDEMKLKMMQSNNSMVLVVSGMQQELIIREECGCFIIELLEKCENNTQPIAIELDAQEEICLATEKEKECLASENKDALLLIEKEECIPTKNTDDTPETARNDDLFKKLVLLRKSLAVANSVPPYLVFHDKTLREMVSKMPMDLHAMGNISGVGHAKLEKYGAMFLEAIHSTQDKPCESDMGNQSEKD